MKSREIIKFQAVAIKADILGFYKTKGLASKSGKCRHISCGAKPTTKCPYFEELDFFTNKKAMAEHYAANPKDVSQMDINERTERETVAQWKENEAFHTERLTKYKGHHPSCTSDWCVRFHGARPENVGEMVKCSRIHYEPYTDEELAVPTTKPESVGIQMKLAFPNQRDVTYAVGLYDLLEDRWFNDGWWTRSTSNIIMPHKDAKTYNWPHPCEVANIKEIIDALKRSL